MLKLIAKLAGRCGAAILSLSLLVPTAAYAGADNESSLADACCSDEDFSQLAQLRHSQATAIAYAFVARSLAQAGRKEDASLFRRLSCRQWQKLKSFDRLWRREEKDKAVKGQAQSGAGQAESAADSPLDLAACRSSCLKGMDGIANGEIDLAQSMTVKSLEKVSKFSDAQAHLVAPALAGIDELILSRYFACGFPVLGDTARTKESLISLAAVLGPVAPGAVHSFNWHSASARPLIWSGQNALARLTARHDAGEQFKVAGDARQLAWLYKRVHDYEKAELWYRRVLPYYLEHAAENARTLRDVYYELGELRLFQLDDGDALQFYQQALAVDFTYPERARDSFWTLDRLAQTCVRLERFEQSDAYSRLALKALCPDASNIDFSRAPLQDLLSSKQVMAAFAGRSGPEVRGCLQTLADQCWRAEKYDQVKLILEFLLGKNPAESRPLLIEEVPVSAEAKKGAAENNRTVLVQLGYLHLYDGDFGQGIACFDRVLPARQNTGRDKADYYAARGQLADDLGLDKQAQADFGRAIHLYKNYCRKKKLDAEDREWVNDYIHNLAWQNYIKRHFAKDSDYLKAVDPHKWPKRQIKVCVSEDGQTGFDQQTAEKLFAVFETWSEASARRLTCIRVPEAEAADITVERVSDNAIVGRGSGGRTTYEYQFVQAPPARAAKSFAGEEVEQGSDEMERRLLSGQKWALCQETVIAKAHIYLICPTPRASELSKVGEARLLSLTLHEAGHALGLDGHSPHGRDIMNWKSAATTLSPYDIASLSHLYDSRE